MVLGGNSGAVRRPEAEPDLEAGLMDMLPGMWGWGRGPWLAWRLTAGTGGVQGSCSNSCLDPGRESSPPESGGI